MPRPRSNLEKYCRGFLRSFVQNPPYNVISLVHTLARANKIIEEKKDIFECNVSVGKILKESFNS